MGPGDHFVTKLGTRRLTSSLLCLSREIEKPGTIGNCVEPHTLASVEKWEI
jgi:hypothetical protein